MKKSDLVAGKHVVEMRNGDIALLVYSAKGTVLEFVGSKMNICNLESYNDDLSQKMSEFDIMKVGLITYITGLFEDIKWIWDESKTFKGFRGVLEANQCSCPLTL